MKVVFKKRVVGYVYCEVSAPNMDEARFAAIDEWRDDEHDYKELDYYLDPIGDVEDLEIVRIDGKPYVYEE